MAKEIPFQFEKDLAYQVRAIDSIVDLFSGQTPMETTFSIAEYRRQIGVFDTDNGMGNKLELSGEELLKNLQAVQLREGLAQTERLGDAPYNFSVEMETGTGKTYVYIRTILELHKRYGFAKFIVVVPSIAIKEGVYQSFETTKEHFNELYDNTPYNYFIYDSNKLERVRSFAASDHIEIMIINIDAFRRSFTDIEREIKANIIHRPHEHLRGMKPIELIQETCPFVIIDEPQSVDRTPKAKEAIKSLNPLCIFRYSATHIEQYSLVYKLDAVDSYNLGLVKQIEVAGFESRDQHNRAYMKLISVDNRRTPITARLALDVQTRAGTIARRNVTVKQGDDLYEISGGRDVYTGYLINDIHCEPKEEYVDFTTKAEILRIGTVFGDIDDLVIKEQQIRKTIEEHFTKELLLYKQGIKVLSLFFIDRVANYRYYDAEGNPQQGIYAQLFEKHYLDLISRPKFAPLRDGAAREATVGEVHNGYFSADRRGVFKDTSGKTQADEDVYSLIMRDKGRLLSFDTKLRFIFSHSALREGWDNQNVFQICTLNETRSEIKKRQEIGRGLRLCVNQAGERQHGFAINTLTVMANESYEQFAQALQKEYEEESNIRFGVIGRDYFAYIPIQDEHGALHCLGQTASNQLYEQFLENNYIDDAGQVQDALRIDLRNNTLRVSEEFTEYRQEITALLRRACSTLNIRNAADKKAIRLNKKVYLDPAFAQLWDRVKHKTTYSVDFDSATLIKACCDEIQRSLVVSAPKLVYTKAAVKLGAAGVDVEETDRYQVVSTDEQEYLPDIIGYLQNETNLTRKTLVEVLIQSNKLDLFVRNPQRYMERVAEIIKAEMRLLIVDGIRYTKIGDDRYYAQELFETEELYGYLHKNMLKSEKSPFDYVLYDSNNEENFARNFEANSSVKLYAKLPSWFTITTPLGTYNPDWVVLIETEGRDALYFVLETKANISFEALRPSESAKIACGEKHFAALGTGAQFKAIDDFARFMENDIS